MNKIDLLVKIKNESVINFKEIPENLFSDSEVLEAIKNNFSEIFNQDEFMELFYVHLKNNVNSIDEDDFLLLNDAYRSDKEILQKCNPEIWGWSDVGLNTYKSIVKINYSKDEEFIFHFLISLSQNHIKKVFFLISYIFMVNHF